MRKTIYIPQYTYNYVKKIISIILSISILFSISAKINFSSFAYGDYQYGDYEYYIDSETGTARISGYTGNTDNLVNLTIPSKINGLPVTEVFRAFNDCSNLESVVIPEGVTSIFEIFDNCYNLKSVTLPDSLENIGGFYNCYNLTDIKLPNNLINIEANAFAGSGLLKIKIPDSVSSIEYGAFKNCYNLGNITLGKGLISVDEKAFVNTPYWNDADNWFDGIFYIGNDLVGYNSDDKHEYDTLNLKYNTERILIDFTEYSAPKCKVFYVSDNNQNFKTINGVLYNKDVTELICYPAKSENADFDIPYGISKIPSECFKDNTYLVNVEIPNSVTKIESGAFENCTSLIKVILPKNLKEISSNLFNGCESLYSIEIPYGVNEIGFSSFYNTAITEIVIPETINYIDDYAFAYCKSLSKIVIPKNECRIGGKVFTGTAYYNDSKNWINGVLYLDSYCLCGKKDYDYKGVLKIKDGTKYICSNAFGSGDSSEFNSTIEQIIIPDSVEKIYTFAFQNLPKFKSVSIGSGVNYLEDNWFHSNLWFYAPPFEKIDVSEKNKYYSSLNGVLFNKDKTILLMYPEAQKNDIYTVPDSVRIINTNAFRCKNLNSIVLSKNVEKIKKYAFYDSTIKDITILNKNCIIENDAINENIIIKGFSNSISQQYAETYDRQFIAIDNYAAQIKFYDINNYELYNDYLTYTSINNSFIAGTNPPYYTEFSPRTAITRAMFVAILYRMAGNPYDGANPYKSNPFSDISPSAYYYNAACWALDEGITNQTTFKPNDNVTREQTARFLYAYAESKDLLGDEAYKNVNLGKYPDYSSVHSWAVEPLQWANYNDMITGTSQGYINPQGATQRIHATRILYGFGKACNIGNFE